MGIIALLVVMQLIPANRSNPPVTQEIRWDSPEKRALAQRACFDCHSNETVWPWYSRVAPISFRMVDHVNHGRRHVNFSAWDQPNQEAHEIIEVIRDGEMPLSDYLLLHSEVKLTADETAALISGLERTLAADPPLK